MSAIKRFIEDEVTRISEDTDRDWCEVMDEYMEKINQSEDPIKIGYIPVEYNRYKELVEKAEKYDRLSGWNLPGYDTSHANSLYEDFMNDKNDYIVLDFHDYENCFRSPIKKAYQCPNCGIHMEYLFEHCPNCGAKMEGEE